MEGARPRRLSVPPRRHGPADAGEHRGGGVPRHPGRQDRLLPQRRHPGAARGAGRRGRRLARRALRAAERRRPAGRQARHREVPAHAHGPRRRSPLPQPRASRSTRARSSSSAASPSPMASCPGEQNFLLDFDAIEAAITPRTKLLIFNNLHNPTGAESPEEEIAALAELALEARPVRAVGRGLLGRALLGQEQLDRLAAGHARADGHPLHVQQEVRDDRLAAGRRDRAGRADRAHRHPERQPGVLHDALHPVGRASRRSPATSPAREQIIGHPRGAARRGGGPAQRDPGGRAATGRRRRSTCSPTSPA